MGMTWNRMETAHFTLLYDACDRALVEKWSRRMDEAFERVTRDFALDVPEEKFSLYLCPDVPTFMAYAGKTPETYETWMVGNTDYDRRRLCLLSPRVVTDRPPEAMDQVLIHEIIHIAMDALRSGEDCPLWLGEGIATLYAEQVYAQSAEASPLISELEENFVGNGGYDYAGAYVWYLIEQHGAERFKRVYAGEEPVSAVLYPGFERDAVLAWQRREKRGFTANPAG